MEAWQAFYSTSEVVQSQAFIKDITPKSLCNIILSHKGWLSELHQILIFQSNHFINYKQHNLGLQYNQHTYTQTSVTALSVTYLAWNEWKLHIPG